VRIAAEGCLFRSWSGDWLRFAHELLGIMTLLPNLIDSTPNHGLSSRAILPISLI
jgi:hypothetical protein